MFQEDLCFQCLNQHHICNKYGKSESYRPWSNWKKKKMTVAFVKDSMKSLNYIFLRKQVKNFGVILQVYWVILDVKQKHCYFFFSLKEMHWVQGFWVSTDLTCVAGHWAIHSHCSSWPEVPKEQDEAQTELWCRGCCTEASARRNRFCHVRFSFQLQQQHLCYECPDSSKANRFFQGSPGYF